MRKKAIVTGGAVGMGRGIALILAEEGYDIAFSHYGNDEKAEKEIEATMEMLKERGAKSWCKTADLTEKSAPKEFFDWAVGEMKGLDLLVNNAGVNMPLPLQELTEENIDYLFALDQRAYVLLMHYAAVYMIENGIKGSIVNVSSSRGERAYPNAGIYCGIKAGLNHMIQAFALDVADYGIRINNVAPGAVRVRSKEELLAIKEGSPTDYFWDPEYKEHPEKVENDFWDRLGPKIPLSRAGETDDIGHAVAFLASDKASYITGVTLRVDGGLIIPGMPEDPLPPGRGWK